MSIHKYFFAFGDQPWKEYASTTLRHQTCGTKVVLHIKTDMLYCPKCKEETGRYDRGNTPNDD